MTINTSTNLTQGQKELTIIWPSYSNKGVYELDFSIKFCKDYLKESLAQLEFKTYWVEDLNETDWDKWYQNILFIGNPRLVISSVVIKNLICVLSEKISVCAPCLTTTSVAEQQGEVLFPILNSSNYEELVSLLNEKEVFLKESNKIDTACFVSTKEFIKSNFKTLIEKPEIINKVNNNTKFSIIENSLAFMFSETYGTEREDLIKLIPNHSKKILDIGSAEGSMGQLIKKTRPDILADAIEQNTVLADLAKPHYEKVYKISIEDFKPDIKYDALICGDVIEHLENPWEQIRRFYEMLKHNSYLILSIPNAGHWSLVMDMMKGKFEYLPVGLTCITHIRWFTEKSIIKTIKDSGFEIDLIERQQIKPTPKGQRFINKMIETGYGDEVSLLTNEFTIRAIKK